MTNIEHSISELLGKQMKSREQTNEVQEKPPTKINRNGYP